MCGRYVCRCIYASIHGAFSVRCEWCGVRGESRVALWLVAVARLLWGVTAVGGAQRAACVLALWGAGVSQCCASRLLLVCVLCAVCVCYLLYVVPDCATTMMALLAPDGRAGLARTAGVGSKWAVLVVCVVCMVAVCAAALRC